MNYLISEILRGNWLLENPNKEIYNLIVKNILQGNILENKSLKAVSYLSEDDDADNSVKEINKVAVISMIGEMAKYDNCGWGAVSFVKEIRKANANPNIEGIILFIDGPGGNADAISLFQQVKPEIQKPIVALVDRACSLHYWIAALLADHIMLNDNFQAEVGSIGSMIVFEKPTNEIIIIRPEESKDKNQALVEALEGKYQLLEERLSILSQKFMQEIKENRPKVKEEALHGKTYLPEEAIKVGLADSIGDINKAYNLVLAKSELKKIKK